MLATGVDLVQVDRIQAAMTRFGDRFLIRVFTDGERAYCHGRPPELAARFAAKEAASKVLGVGLEHPDGVGWREVEVISGERGQPSLHLTGRAARRADELGLVTFALSLSHTQEYAIAVIVAE